ncbi:MAG: TetR/AcrR family transcriptional regulator [Mycobacteriales bacterium]
MTRSRLLATAEGMFFARGYIDASVDAIAYEAGYTTGAVYSNFGGKADLFLAVLELATAADLAAVRAALDEAHTDEQRLGVFATTIVGDPARWQARVAATLEFVSYARRHPELHARMRAAQQLADEAVGELLTASCRALGLDPPESTQELTRDVTALINGLAIRWLFDDQLDIARAVSSGINSLLTGNRAELLDLHSSPGLAGRSR